ncbi:MAG: hypothetical protein E6Q24_14185 [Chitinophagaceae bacterium]|nr:MAG: hypothetical protein E6Q24_14185 [Chitinophagaceae bacterium]
MDRVQEILTAYFNSGILEEARKIRQGTFDELAHQRNMSSTELENVFGKNALAQIDNYLAFYANNPIDEAHRLMLEQSKKDFSYWKHLDYQEVFLSGSLIDLVYETFPDGIPCDLAYLHELAKELPVPLERLAGRNDFQDFLIQIPQIYRFDLDFNAFLTGQPLVYNVPVVGFNYLLFAVLDSFIQMVFYTIMDSSDNYATNKLRPVPEILDRAEDKTVSGCFHSIFEMLVGRAGACAVVNVGSEASLHIFHSIVPPAQNFVKLHELGHLFMGHLTKERSKQLEFQADAFAMLYIDKLLKDRGKGIGFKVYLGLAALFILMHCRTQILNLNGGYHPTVVERVKMIVYRFEHNERVRFAKAWNNIIAASGFTLKKFFNCSIPIFEYYDE